VQLIAGEIRIIYMHTLAVIDNMNLEALHSLPFGDCQHEKCQPWAEYHTFTHSKQFNYFKVQITHMK
jgi:hypothetical protein